MTPIGQERECILLSAVDSSCFGSFKVKDLHYFSSAACLCIEGINAACREVSTLNWPCFRERDSIQDASGHFQLGKLCDSPAGLGMLSNACRA